MTKKGVYHFLLMYPLKTAPSQRFRFEQYFPLLERHNITFTTSSFYDDKTYSLLYLKRKKFLLVFRLMICFIRRCRELFLLRRCQYIFIQRAASPFGPPIFEWIIRFIYNKKIIYDFDDAIWMPQFKTSALGKWMKGYYKVKYICKWSHRVVVGNEYLFDYASRFSKHVYIIPTVVDTDNFKSVTSTVNNPVNIGWTGSHSTLLYLELLEPVLYKLQQKYKINICVIANKKPDFTKVDFQFIPWSETTEVEDLSKIDIGIMPLPLDLWTQGKCGFKALQYMALQKPAVASAVGVNNAIIDNGSNGFLCDNFENWESNLSYLIEHPTAILEFGQSARLKVIKDFSLKKAEVLWCEVLMSQ
jgi:glycosyltransferase involved in cell wall biosynthesis